MTRARVAVLVPDIPNEAAPKERLKIWALGLESW